MLRIIQVVILSWLFIPSLAFAGNVESAAAYYSEDSQNTYIGSASATVGSKLFSKKSGYSSTFNLGMTYKQTEFTDLEDPGINKTIKQLDGETTLRQYSFSGSYTQGLGTGDQVGVNGGYGTSEVGSSAWTGLNYGHWWLQETLQTVFSITRTWVSQIPETLNARGDLHLVNIPAKLQDWNFGLSLYQLTTPQLILRSSYNLATRTDRPNAHSFTAEGRYFVEATNSAIHLKGAYYINLGEIKPVTLYGEVEAYSAAGEWHQRLFKRWVLMGGYRYYFERETPESKETSIEQVASDYIYGSLRWRWKKTRWTKDESPEIYVFGGYYNNNAPKDAFISGIGTNFYF